MSPPLSIIIPGAAEVMALWLLPFLAAAATVTALAGYALPARRLSFWRAYAFTGTAAVALVVLLLFVSTLSVWADTGLWFGPATFLPSLRWL